MRRVGDAVKGLGIFQVLILLDAANPDVVDDSPLVRLLIV